MSVPVVVALTGHPQIGGLLDDGYRRQLFVTRTDAASRSTSTTRCSASSCSTGFAPTCRPTSSLLAPARRRAARGRRCERERRRAVPRGRRLGECRAPDARRCAGDDRAGADADTRGSHRRPARRGARTRALARVLGGPRAREHRAVHRARDLRARAPGIRRARRHRRADPGCRGGDRLALSRLGGLAADPSLGRHPRAAACGRADVRLARQPRRARCPRSRSGSRTAGRDTRCSRPASIGWRHCSTRSWTGPRA